MTDFDASLTDQDRYAGFPPDECEGAPEEEDVGITEGSRVSYAGSGFHYRVVSIADGLAEIEDDYSDVNRFYDVPLEELTLDPAAYS